LESAGAEWDGDSLEVTWLTTGDDPYGWELVLIDGDENTETIALDGAERSYSSENSAYSSGGEFRLYPLNSCGERVGLNLAGGW
jgi:hypothetical protein